MHTFNEAPLNQWSDPLYDLEIWSLGAGLPQKLESSKSQSISCFEHPISTNLMHI